MSNLHQISLYYLPIYVLANVQADRKIITAEYTQHADVRGAEPSYGSEIMTDVNMCIWHCAKDSTCGAVEVSPFANTYKCDFVTKVNCTRNDFSMNVNFGYTLYLDEVSLSHLQSRYCSFFSI